MYIIEIVLKNTAIAASLQYKTPEEAQNAYQKTVEAMSSGQPSVLELTCEQPGQKTVTLKSSEIIAINMYDKSGGSASGRQPGFFAVAQ
jgi:hypothetical protein